MKCESKRNQSIVVLTKISGIIACSALLCCGSLEASPLSSIKGMIEKNVRKEITSPKKKTVECADFSGSWVGICTSTSENGQVDQSEESMMLMQRGCYALEFRDIDNNKFEDEINIGEMETESRTNLRNGEYGATSSTNFVQSNSFYDWDKERKQLNLQFTFLDAPFTGEVMRPLVLTGYLRLADPNTLNSHVSLNNTPNNESNCTYQRK